MHHFPLDEEWPRYSRLFTAEQLRELGPSRPLQDLAVRDEPIALTTGPATMTAALVCRDTAHLYRFVTERLVH